jgi:hypothetical protein
VKEIFDFIHFLNAFNLLQEKMLFLEKEEVQRGFKILYENARHYFKNLFDENKSSKRVGKNYFVKKQSELVLRYLKDLDQINTELKTLSDPEIIRLFEKQYKFKKILLRLRDHRQKN